MHTHIDTNIYIYIYTHIYIHSKLNTCHGKQHSGRKGK